MADIGIVYGILISLGVLALIYFTGLSVLYCLKSELKGLYRTCCSFAVGVPVHAAVGLFILLFADKQLGAIIGLSVLYLFVSGTLVHSRVRKSPFFFLESSRDAFILLAIFCLFITLCNVLVYGQIDFPAQLHDGPYITKKHTLPVKIQVVTQHLPADNIVAYLVSEYFLRDIDFRAERPLLPGQEVTNRTIIMSLVAMPFRSVFYKPEKFNGSLGKYNYLGTEWPDFSKLVDNRYYSIFVSIGLALNSLIFFPFLLLYKELVGRKYLILASLVFILTPYVIIQTVFIWPKNLAAFFILLALYRVIVGEKGIAFTFILLGLAYNSHPFALVFIGGFFAYYLLQDWKEKRLNSSLKAIAITILMLGPWIVWGNMILQIKSDLIMQNFISDSRRNFVWVRVYHLYMVWFPSYLDMYPFDARLLFQRMMLSVPGIIGGVTFVFSYYSMYQLIKSNQREWMALCLLLPLTLIVCIFSRPVTPIFHGFQVMIPVLIILAFRCMQNFNKTIVVVLFTVQSLVGVALYADYLKDQNFRVNLSGASEYSLLDHGKINIVNSDKEVHVGVSIPFQNGAKKCVWMNPVTTVSFDDISIKQGDAFESILTFHPEVVGLATNDGALFKIDLLEEGKVLDSHEYFYQADGKMNELHLELNRYAGKTISIQLSVLPGPGKDLEGDWCLWVAPKIVSDSDHN
ncbi:hypothetical protein [Gimesia sp.]|uniref:hypothetical protein n=1 Tax=Gimesia sp. TaxID=2024833 RepID=UPI003A8E1ACE